MHYSIRHSTTSLQPYFLGSGKVDPRSTEKEETVWRYRTTDPAVFGKMVEEIMDVPEYEITGENVRKEFDPICATPLKPEKLTAIVRYYSGRKDIRDRILRDVGEFSKNPSNVSFYRLYQVPDCSLGFTTKDFDEYAPSESSETIEVSVGADFE